MPKLRSRATRRSRWLTLMFLAATALVAGTATARETVVAGYEYLSPLPDSRLVRARNGVIFRTGARIDSTTVTQGLLQVIGSESGLHTGSLALSDDLRTLNFVLDAPYTRGETVSVTLLQGIETSNGYPLPPLGFEFHVSPQPVTASARPFDSMAIEVPEPSSAPAPTAASPVRPVVLDTVSCGLPAMYPGVSVLSSNNPEPGDIFLAPFSAGGNLFSNAGHLLIVDNHNVPMFWRRFSTERPLDFRQQPNGLLSYIGSEYAYLMDDTYAVVDSFKLGNGYPIDGHDFQLLANGHVLLMSYDPQPVRMDSLVPGGNPNASVEGLVLQELDASGRVVFQWRSWDYIPITDCNSGAVNMIGARIDYIHGNAMEVDVDGNWLISSRHTNEITKINRTTGEVMWRMGLKAVGNQFRFPNDTRGFSHQHDIRRQPNGNLTLFDNGNFLSPQYSRALEFEVDEVNKIATVVWDWGTSPTTFGGFMGNVQKRPGGSKLVCWGGNNATPLRISDLHPDDSPALELGLPTGTWSYRAYRIPWRNRRIDMASDLDFGTVPYRSPSATRQFVVRNGSSTDVTINCVTNTNPVFTVDASVPATIAPGDSITLHVTFDTNNSGEFHDVLYVHSLGDSEIVAGRTEIKVVTDPLVVIGGGPLGFGLREIRPNPVSALSSLAFDLPRRTPVTIEVFGVSGRRVATVVSGVREAGHHEVSWDASRLAHGIYFLRLRAADREVTRKLVRVN